jgi:hypothetical protein
MGGESEGQDAKSGTLGKCYVVVFPRQAHLDSTSSEPRSRDRRWGRPESGYNIPSRKATCKKILVYPGNRN